MSQYVSVGVTDEQLTFSAANKSGTSTGTGIPFNSLFDFIDSLKLKAEIALTDPRIKQFMQEAGIKAEQAQAEAARRKKQKKQKNNLLLWGGAAAVVGFLVLRKKR